MPKTHLKKFYQEQEKEPTAPPSSSSSSAQETKSWFCYNNNPLNQFADITLAASTRQEMLLAQYLHSRLQGLQGQQHHNELTPSNSPSPPPAHISSPLQRLKPLLKPYGVMDLLPPPQTAPEDLRVVARKIDFPVQAADTTTSPPRSAAGDLDDEQEMEDLMAESVKSSDSGGSHCHQHECPECGKSYSTSSNLARHRQTHRSLEDKKARKCPHCEKTYVSMPAYSMHIRTHNQGCKCPFCGKCFSRPWLLQGHIRTHTGEKPFSCHICNKAFADKSNLRAHIQTHSNTKPFVCVRCNKAFALKSYLYKHEESSCMRTTSPNVLQKMRRKGNNLQSQASPSSTSVSDDDTAFGQQLLLALTKARAAAAAASAFENQP